MKFLGPKLGYKPEEGATRWHFVVIEEPTAPLPPLAKPAREHERPVIEKLKRENRLPL